MKTHDADRTKRDILRVATQAFSDDGLAGARIDDIAAKTQTSKRMIYYYFGSKDDLYKAVLETEYGRMRALEALLDLDPLPPLQALRKLVGFTFDFTWKNQHFVRLVMIENIHRAAFLAQLPAIRSMSAPMIDNVRRLYERGVAERMFRPGIQAVDLHWQISALAFFGVSNRPTFFTLFGKGAEDEQAEARLRQNVLDMVESFVVFKPDLTESPRDSTPA